MSTGFSFGAKTTAPPAFGTGSMTFVGTSQPQATATSFQMGGTGILGTPSTPNLFGSSAAASRPTFGMPNATGLGSAPSGPGLFGTQPQAASIAPTGAFGFGTPASTAALPGGLGFGATPTTAPPAFGASIGSAPPAFGSTKAPVVGTALTFGAPQASAAPTSLTFGTPASAAPSALGFGTQLSTAPAASTGSTFGTQLSTAPTATTGLAFGAQSTTAPTGLSFGAQPSAASTGLAFGAASTATPTLGLSFGTASTAAPTLGFGTTSVSTSAPGGLSFGMGAAATSSGGLGFGGLGGINATTATAQFSLTPASTAAPSVGLGGIASTQAKTTVTTQKEIPPKDQPLPNEILQTVEQFKQMLKEQKAHCSDIARCSVKEFRKVEQEIDTLNSIINDVELQLQKNRHLVEKLKYDAAKSLQDVEMAQRTNDTPPGLQYENTAPLRYFLDLADNFERQMQTIRAQIECADKFVKSNKTPEILTPQDLSMGMRRLHEVFVALAGRLQTVHSQVEAQKESYINLRKHLFNDYSDPFEKLSHRPEDQMNLSNLRTATLTFYSPPKIACGPTPFGHLALGGMNPMLQQHNSPPPAYPGNATTNPSTQAYGNASTFGTQLGSQPSNTSLFGQQSFGSTALNSSFQLQKPPTGNKRGKI